ncbi:MAG: hypothetical protein C0518_09840 [Opitutus sp.]|nr:hypothetical protein [Opitutus sp.]
MKAAVTTGRTNYFWTGLALFAAAGWLWISWCRVPASSWNDLRLTAVFMGAQGEPVYTLPGAGVLTTWMYGPVPLWLWSPAVLARDAVSAVLAAGAINLLLALAALGATCLLWPSANARPSDRWLALALTCLIWPEPAFRFLQADNLLVALGLAANLVLALTPPSARRRWLAALATAAALGCKPTALALLLAQLVWLFRAEGARSASFHLGRTLLTGGALAAAAVAQFGWRELWFGAVTVPARLPWADAPWVRLADLAPHLAVQGGAALLVLLAFGRALRRESRALELPMIAWGVALPFGLAGILTTGGTTNNLHGFQWLLPAVLVAALGLARQRWTLAPAFAAGIAAVLLSARLATTDHLPLRPATARLHAADQIARAAPDATWLPWAPLVGYFASGRFDHTEDGIYVRFITGHPVSFAQAHAHLPPHFTALVLPGDGADWGLAAKLAPPPLTIDEIGGWRVLRWEKPVPLHNRTSAPPPVHP